jgi:hypothetical protein
MTEAQGMMAGVLLALALLLYIFWPRKGVAPQGEEHAPLSPAIEPQKSLPQDTQR